MHPGRYLQRMQGEHLVHPPIRLPSPHPELPREQRNSAAGHTPPIPKKRSRHPERLLKLQSPRRARPRPHAPHRLQNSDARRVRPLRRRSSRHPNHLPKPRSLRRGRPRRHRARHQPHHPQNSAARQVRPLRRKSSLRLNHLLKPKSPLHPAAAPPLHRLSLPVASREPRPDHNRPRPAARRPHQRTR
jgi:hypothetical protein